MTENPKFRKRKVLTARCPKCESSQVRERKFLGTWICQSCDHVFKKPRSDVKK